MKNQFLHFKSLHEASEPLLIANVWDAPSAAAFDKLNYKALATSSAAVAETLGYSDGEQMSFAEYLFVVEHIVRATSLPVSVDLEAGYGNTAEEFAGNIRALAARGVAGINLEDSIIKNGTRSLLDASLFADRLKAISESLKTSGTNVFINVRCDVFLLGLPSPVAEAKRRIPLYESAGAHGLFFPCITAVDDIRSVVAATTRPVNVMCMPELPGFASLREAGVRRISMGNFLHKHLYGALEVTAKKIITEGTFQSLFA